MSNYYDEDEINYLDSYKDYRDYVSISAQNDEEPISWYDYKTPQVSRKGIK